LFVLLQLCNPATEQPVDDFEFADAGLEGGVLGDKLLEGWGDFEVVCSVQGGGRAAGRWLTKVELWQRWGVIVGIIERVAVESGHMSIQGGRRSTRDG